MSLGLHRARTDYSHSGSESGYSDSSDQSGSTAPTLYSVRPELKHFKTAAPSFGGHEPAFSPRSSYSATSSASSGYSDEERSEDAFEYNVPDESFEVLASSAIPSTPSDFAHLFPSTRRLHIRHDDATVDGNMNLRVDTEAFTSGGRKLALTLFHLRMHDLRHREFSLRRYCRDSGREVCHSSRKVVKPTPGQRPTFPHSVSSALSSIRSRSENKTSTTASLARRDSGYSSDDNENIEPGPNMTHDKDGASTSKSAVRLEFSNYAHVDVKPRGTKTSKKYEFEFWGTKYAWKRVARRDYDSTESSYNLINVRTGKPVAYIVPEALTIAEADEEKDKGGWVPPCSMWISDEKVLSGVTDVAESV